MKCSCQILMLLICTMVLLFNCQFYGMISYTLNLGCTDTPFLVSCWCWTRVGHRNGYDSPDSGFRRVSSFFFFRFSDMRRCGADTAPMLSTRQQWRKKENFGIFRVIPAIPANFGRNENFVRYKILTEKKKKKKSKSKSYLLLLGFVLFFLLFFFLISVSSSSSSSSSSFGFGLLPDYLFFFICVSWLSSTCV